MRTISVNLYKYGELPTDLAKDAARAWWRNSECQWPSFSSDHNKSVKVALKFIDSFRMFDFDKLYTTALELKAKGECLWTGYHDDLTAIEGIVEACKKYDDIESIVRYVKNYMSADYEKQLEVSLEEKNVIGSIIANEYEFTADGSIYH